MSTEATDAPEPVAGPDRQRPMAVRSQPIAEIVANELRRRIIEGEIADGEKLPPLNDLLNEFGVSKPSVRDALRILEAEGLVTVKRGKYGGSVIHFPKASNAAYTIQLVLGAQSVADTDVAIALDLLEPLCAMLCAELPDRGPVGQLLRQSFHEAEAAADAGDADRFVDASRRFHHQIVTHCGNQTLILLIGSLQAVWRERTVEANVLGGTSADKRDWPFREQHQLRTLDDHRLILSMIERGDGEAVARIARDHLKWVQDVWRQNAPTTPA